MSNGKKPDDNYEANLLRYVSATAYTITSLLAAQQLFGRGYCSLSPIEKAAVDQTVNGLIAGNYHSLTSDYFAGARQAGKAGFQPGQPAPQSQAEPSKESES